MTCASCRATFANLECEGSERARLLDEKEPGCRCQLASVSDHSPGRVTETEFLLRVVVAPQHVTKAGLPRAAALTDAERGGLSIFREAHATDEQIFAVARQLVDKARARQGKKAGIRGVIRIECASVRSFCEESDDTPCYCVYDTGTMDTPSHAEAFQRVAGVDASVCEGRRRGLFNRVKAGFISVDEFRDGLLRSLAPAGA